MVRSARNARVSNHEAANEAAPSFETRSCGALLRMRRREAEANPPYSRMRSAISTMVLR
jgi:hypothetical protein